ncbi:hypothetical protein Acsp04_11900 [Actinomadura sp. NBRC 104425]|uniref:DUF6528 family protein n=1 Tax=Actinomadura sp. NBRC 104425 TaxID=3032204 RepID=UPI0024A370F7|nr:DUF6528 family protein [Actinomadura sp. NBRC 104425]GLZ10955.1 hypothetical protein Acsp04_11900 [Actinomadura sp. NBRC 104425]
MPRRTVRRRTRPRTVRRTCAALAATAVAAVGAPPAAAEPAPPTDPLPRKLRPALAKPSAQPRGWAKGLVIGGDQAGRRLVVLDAGRRSWQGKRAVKWSWKPTAARGYRDVAGAWGGASDVRVRRRHGRTYVVTAQGAGFAGAVEYPSGRRLWAVDAGRSSGLHAAELLPNGNVAVAAARGHWVRVYAASRGRAARAHAQVRLARAHGLLWDPSRRILWALGDKHLVALRVGGTAHRPTLRAVGRRRLPSAGGHDLAPVFGNRNRLWITTHHGVYQYDKRRGVFTTRYRLAPRVNKRIVKSVGDHPRTGQVLLTRPKKGCATSWCTDTLEFFGPGRRTATRVLRGAQFYRARWFVPRYQ